MTPTVAFRVALSAVCIVIGGVIAGTMLMRTEGVLHWSLVGASWCLLGLYSVRQRRR
ncbi:hypothetical protein [Streptomyces sp. NPDC058394]|uniref:hypothetical protein n=1 Tax=Streptomyces sp. NPDC058394 TaxID=3346477 RepID=UPI00364D325D